MGYHYTPIEWPKFRTEIPPDAGEGVEQKRSFTPGGNAK